MTDSKIYDEVAVELLKFEFPTTAQTYSFDDLKKAISNKLNSLITSDFFTLISLLYRLDISEKKLKESLTLAGNTPAGDILAEMIITRQVEKINSRKAFGRQKNDIPEEEKW